jgi:diacylglycerol O-acyltransferase / wax synthase
MVALVEQFITYVDGSPMECLLPPGMNKKFKIKKPWYRLMFEVLLSTVKVLSMPSSTYDHPTVFSKGNNKDMIHSQNRELVRFMDTPLDFVKEIKNAANVTINDVLYTCLSQAIHDYLVNEKCPVLVQHGSRLQCRSLMPVAFPRPPAVMQDKEQTLRNNWCFVETDFFVGHKDITERLKLVNAHMMALKTSPLAMVQLKIQNSLPLVLPLGFNRKVVFDTMSKRSLVFSNVPGPTKPCLFAGKEVVGVQMFFSNLISQIGFISYRGEIFGNICVDPEEVPNCKSLSIFYSRALVQLAGSLNVHVPDVVAKHAERALV